jgi:hypothetical protein
MRINLTEVEDRSFEAIPSGRYILRLADYEMRSVKEGAKLPEGTPMINWEFNVVNEAKTGDEKYRNRKIWLNTAIHPKTLFNLKNLLRASGKYTEDELVGEIDFEPEDILGSEMAAVVAQREYQGNTVNDIKRLIPLSEEEGGDDASSLLP